MSFELLTDATCDLSPQILDENNVVCLPMAATLGNTAYKHYPDGREMDYKEFYRRLRAGETPTTSAVNVADWSDAIETSLKKSKEILIIAFSSSLSSTYANACIVAGEMMEKNACRIVVIDTHAASAGEGLIVMEAVRMRNEGESLDEVVAAINNLLPHVAHWFTVDDLHHLHRGGRVSAASAIVGSALGIKPVLHVDDEGRLIYVDKERGRKKSILALIERMKKTIVEPEGPVFISHGDCQEDAEYLAYEIKKIFPVKEVVITVVDPIVGAHSGANTLALFFIASHK